MTVAKIYLSPAAHVADNQTKCPGKCGENTHCNAYMDQVEKRLTALGFSVKRGDKSKCGGPALQSRVAAANKWKADIYYVAHTNAGGGRYSMTLHYPDAASKAKAQVLHSYRKCVKIHKVVATNSLYEINATTMPCLYDELFFHDNAEDCAWFHGGGMEQMAEETVQALCELCGVKYKAIAAEKAEVKAEEKTEVVPVPAKKAPKAGDKVTLSKDKLYLASVGTAAVTRTGTFYLYDGKKVNGRYRVTNKKNRVGKKPVALYVSGWVKV